MWRLNVFSENQICHSYCEMAEMIKVIFTFVFTFVQYKCNRKTHLTVFIFSGPLMLKFMAKYIFNKTASHKYYKAIPTTAQSPYSTWWVEVHLMVLSH